MEEKICFFEDLGMPIEAITWQIVLQDGDKKEKEVEDEYSEIDSNCYRKRTYFSGGSGIEIELALEKDGDDALHLAGKIKNIGKRQLTINRVTLLKSKSSGPAFGDLVFFRQGWQSWSATGSFRSGEADKDPFTGIARLAAVDPANRSPGKPGSFTSDMYAILKNKEEDVSLLLGALQCQRFFTSVYFTRGSWGRLNPGVELRVDTDGLRVMPGETVDFEPHVIFRGDAEEIHKRYLNMVGEKMNARCPEKAPAGWCSWYYYYQNITEKEVLKNLGYLSRNKDRLPLDVVQIDDGYQEELGDWLKPNEKFPSGMKSLADQIRGRGFTPGIWLAPFLFSEDSRFYHDNHNWYILNKKGFPLRALLNPDWGATKKIFALDMTRPQAQEHLYNVIKTVVW